MPDATLTIELLATNFPRRRTPQPFVKDMNTDEPIWLGVQKGQAAKAVIEQRTPGDANRANFTATFTIARKGKALDFKGPYAQGKPGERFFYLSWNYMKPGGTLEMFSRLKIPLSAIPIHKVESALKSGKALHGELSLTDEKGNPLCATAKASHLKWLK